MKKQEEIIKIFEKCNAILKGHFVYTSGRHGEIYVNKDAIYPWGLYIHELCRELVAKFGKIFLNYKTEAVIAPALGGVVLSRLVADYMQEKTGCGVYAVYADKEANGQMIICRGYDKLIKDKNVIILDDIMTTGGTVKKLVAETQAKGARVIGAAVLWNRGMVTADDLGVPRLVSLVKKNYKSWNETACVLCKNSIPINQDVGKGGDFLTRQAFGQITKAANMASEKVFGKEATSKVPKATEDILSEMHSALDTEERK